ncbi:hypothetical protein AYI68_g2697 [Smittium mucronatum]|uniref:Mediator complex subunit 8 n=1 Tax=Smittium mucronatum TaxID=133383 RepID=A0A1R0H210_9FUNG|nr:hypothetical protein AYI68_g2697 [Smittium mucronatum]
MSLVIEDRRAELLSLKSKLLQLIDSYDYFINSLPNVHQQSQNGIVEAFPEPNWLDIFSKFNILAAKYSILVEDIGKAQKQLLSKVVVFPGRGVFESALNVDRDGTLDSKNGGQESLNRKDPENQTPGQSTSTFSNDISSKEGLQQHQQFLQLQQQRISVLLRTKLTPKLEKAEKMIFDKIMLTHKNMNSNGSEYSNLNINGLAHDISSVRYWKNLAELHDVLCLSASQRLAKTSHEDKSKSVNPEVGKETGAPLESIVSFLYSGQLNG